MKPLVYVPDSDAVPVVAEEFLDKAVLGLDAPLVE
eukprot:CAMPEP_0119151872 /NCGR_PEP_ID=MMETSP1310-20130426/46937_1 /TAXON_ID=464262 /ORGANISM="Genus nov. species nov., Strain RCC2339" /LENGTH=34 /DNA_ID= /DNA_START= /DNA_END= /DNA_ORIENTATION=